MVDGSAAAAQCDLLVGNLGVVNQLGHVQVDVANDPLNLTIIPQAQKIFHDEMNTPMDFEQLVDQIFRCGIVRHHIPLASVAQHALDIEPGQAAMSRAR